MPSKTEAKVWADRLDNLLQRAAAAKGADNAAQIVKVQRELRLFKEESPDFADALDRQATLAIFDLDLDSSAAAVAAIRERAEEVRKLTKLIAGVAEEAKADADVLSGRLAIQAIDAATNAIVSFRQLRQSLSTADAQEGKVAQIIDDVVSAVQTLRSQLEHS
jgi:hypothetical protein